MVTPRPTIILHYIHLMAFFRTTWISRPQKGKPFWILIKQEMIGGSGVSWTICKSFALRAIQPCQYFTSQFLWVGCHSCHPTYIIKAPRPIIVI